MFCVFGTTLLPWTASPQNSPPQVRSVSALVDAQHRLVRIRFELIDVNQDSLEINLRISSDGGQTFAVPTDSVAGDVGFPIMPGSQKEIFWYYDSAAVTLPLQQPAVLLAKIVASDRHQVDIRELVARIDSVRMKRDLSFVEGIRHRTTGATHLEATKNFIDSQFTVCNLRTSRQVFSYEGYQAANIIGILQGVTEEDLVYILDGHFDTISSSPGADDNGSGVVGMLEAMRVLSEYAFQHTITFVGLDLEEDGLVGSARYVGSGMPLNQRVGGVFNFEMIGYFSNVPGSQTLPSGFHDSFPAFYDSVASQEFRGNFVSLLSDVNSLDLKSQFEASASSYVPNLRVISLVVPTGSQTAPDFRRGDHASFWDAGYKAVTLSDNAEFRNPYYHTSNDKSETIHVGFWTNVVKATVATVATVAGVANYGVGLSDPFVAPITSVAESHLSRPGSATMSRNYPKPFNPITIIEFELPEAANVRLTVFDVLGQEVAALVNEWRDAGVHRVRFDASDLAGGVYLCRLQTGKLVSMKKLTVVK